MKTRTCAALLIAAIMLTFTGCGLNAAEERLDIVEGAVEMHIDAAEEAVEAAVREVVLPQTEPIPQQPATLAAKAPVPAAESAPPATEPPAPAAEAKPVETIPSAPAAKLTKEEAEAIALKHAGFTRDQVSYLHAEFDFDDRIPEYDVEFREGYWEYEYEIHAETGKILSFEKDD